MAVVLIFSRFYLPPPTHPPLGPLFGAVSGGRKEGSEYDLLLQSGKSVPDEMVGQIIREGRYLLVISVRCMYVR